MPTPKVIALTVLVVSVVVTLVVAASISPVPNVLAYALIGALAAAILKS